MPQHSTELFRVRFAPLLALLASALLLPALVLPAPAVGQTIRITAPVDDEVISIPQWSTYPTTMTPVRFGLEATTASPADRIRLVVDDEPAVTIAADQRWHGAGSFVAGAHVATAWLIDGADTPYPGVVAVVRFQLSRVCSDDADCVDDDPCSVGYCLEGPPDSGSWPGRCRYRPDPGDPDCCVTGEWCRAKGMVFGGPATPYVCADVDGDASGDCVPCVSDADCAVVEAARAARWGVDCVAVARCAADHTCAFTERSGCCGGHDGICDDLDPCTVDACDRETGLCGHTAIQACCHPGSDDERPGPPAFGCAPEDADPCTYHACVGAGAAATCRAGPRYPGCCAVDDDCADALRVDACTDPARVGHGVCAGVGADPRFPAAGTCAYPERDPECCRHDFECFQRYPELIGTCADQPGEDWDRCVYAANPEYCVPPVGTIVITEVMVNPGGPDSHGYVVPDTFGEWFEVFNPTDGDINMDGWVVHDLGDGWGRQSFTVDNRGSFIVPAGGHRIFVRHNSPSANGLPRSGYVWPADDFSLMNGADAIVLRDTDGVIQDSVVYDETWPWRAGAAMALVHPYLDNGSPSSWRTARFLFGDPFLDSRGSPTNPNLDVFDVPATAGLPCDDGDPCTLDLCNLDRAGLCAHRRLRECCTAETAAMACNDQNACSLDRCDLATNQCVHDASVGCCVADRDCADWYPAWVATDAERAAFDSCADKACVAGHCRFGRNRWRPDCCVATDAPSFGCFDRNPCTDDVCVPGAGQDAEGIVFDQCLFDLDLDGDDRNDCCAEDADCGDGDPTTIDACDRADDGEGPGPNRCAHRPDPEFCSPGDGLVVGGEECDDDDPCTDDLCCAGAGAPHPACGGASRCAHVRRPGCCVAARDCVDGMACTADACVDGACRHTEVAGGCCELHADCNGNGTPADLYCRTGYCIGHVCRYGPPIAGCCLTATDCPTDVCATVDCVDRGCRATPVEGCCRSDDDCPRDSHECRASVCLANRCTEVDRPGCCIDDHPDGPDTSCDDRNPCTSDWCLFDGTRHGCRYAPAGGPGCCTVKEGCPDDRVPCTDPACRDRVCALDPATDCVAAPPYRMTFTEGHAVYVGEYQTPEDLAWTPFDLGAPAPFFGFAADGALGPDRYLTFRPTASVADFDACVALPPVRTVGLSHATLAFDHAGEGDGAATLRVLGRRGGPWSTAQTLWSAPIGSRARAGSDGADSDPEAAAHADVSLPPALVDADRTHLAFCVAGATTEGLSHVMIDEVVLAPGRPPELAAFPTRQVAKGQTTTFVSAFAVTERDPDDILTVSVVHAPTSWLRIQDVRRVPGATTQWTADLVVTDAPCPASAPYEHPLTVRAVDGALEDTRTGALRVTGCP